jgi:Double-GTPase 2
MGEAARALGYAIYAVVAFVFGVLGGLAVGAAQAVGCYLVPMCRVAAGRIDGLPPPERTLRQPPDRDPAVPDYLHGPARVDLAYVRQLAGIRARDEYAAWRDQIDAWTNPPLPHQRRTALPPASGFALGLAVGAVPGGVVVLGLAVVHELVAGLLGLLWRVTGLLLRGLDSALRRVRSIRMRCVACFERLAYPAYRCPGCGATHWDIRPGPLGVVRRTCLCGRRLPTLLMLGTGTLDARCSFRSCGSELPHGPGTLPEVVLPVFGARGAGKTRLMYALVAALEEAARQRGVDVEPADPMTAERLARVHEHLPAERPTAATPTALQRGLVLRLRIRRRQRLVQLFDAAGEIYYREETSSELRYLGSGRTFVLVVDPLSVDGFWDGLPPDEGDRLGGEPPAGVPQPSLVFQQTTERIVELGGDLRRSRLAVVLSRADLLGAASGPDDPEDWAVEMGLGGLLRTARLSFKEVTVFRTAAVTRNGAVDGSVRHLLTWALALPTEEQPGEVAA